MPILNSIKRRLIETLAGLVNELHIGSDGTVASADDGGARTLARVSPTVTLSTHHMSTHHLSKKYIYNTKTRRRESSFLCIART